MNAVVGFDALGPGAILITTEVADDRVCSVRVVSSRPTGLTRLFVGRSARETPLLVERLYSLCGFSHGVAATQAIAAARGKPAATSQAQIVGLICERLIETLRASFMSRVGAPAADGPAIRPLRRAISLTRELSVLASANHHSSVLDRSATDPLVEEICVAAKELGLSSQGETVAPPKKGSWFGDWWKEMDRDQSFIASVPDALCADDDVAVVERLRSDGERFAAEPSLAGRTRETGAFARWWREVDFSGGALRGRLHARMINIAQDLERLSRASAGDFDSSDVRSKASALREGFAAIETSRGRLYHWARLTTDDKIEEYAIVAPTEWNFHPAGPFVAALLGARIPHGEARRSIARLAGLFDPCVAFRIEVREPSHA